MPARDPSVTAAAPPWPARRPPGPAARAAHRPCASPGRQRGVAIYLFVIAAAIALTTLTLGIGGMMDLRKARADAQDRTLAEARRLLLAHLADPASDGSGRRLGEPGLLPDLPIAAGGGGDALEPNYDGAGETTGCAFRGWTPGTALQPVATMAQRARCFGRLPWRDLGLSLPDADPNDPAGMIPWVVLSPNLKTGSGCLPDLTPLMLGQPYAGYNCANRTPYPWITVLDERGNVVSDRVAVVLIQPGPPLQGQNRTATAGAAAWLDRLTVRPGCPAPCRPGTYDNAAFDHPDNQPTTLINGPRDPVAAIASGLHAEPLVFNDRLAWITVDDLFAALENRARRVLKTALADYRATHLHYPFAAPFDSAGGDCTAGLRFGHPAIAAGSCGAGAALNLPAWFTAAGWHRYFVYAVSSRCVQGSNACNAPGLVVGGTTGVNALLIAPGAPILSPPYAVTRGAAQQPLSGLLPSAAPADYVDSVANAGLVPDVFEPTAGLPAPVNDRLEMLN